MKNNFTKLFEALKAESKTNFERFVKELKAEKEVSKILGSWFYRELMTVGKQKQEWKLPELHAYLIERRTKKDEAKLQEQFNKLQRIFNAGELTSINISIEWKRSRMWGNNPTADAHVSFEKNNGYIDRYSENYSSGSIGGCGYDKESTAIAHAVNQSPEFLRAMYALKEKNIGKDNRDLFGYGSGYGILPNLEGGVGVSCYPKIFATLGYTFKGIAHGKTFDAYSVTKGVEK